MIDEDYGAGDGGDDANNSGDDVNNNGDGGGSAADDIDGDTDNIAFYKFVMYSFLLPKFV